MGKRQLNKNPVNVERKIKPQTQQTASSIVYFLRKHPGISRFMNFIGLSSILSVIYALGSTGVCPFCGAPISSCPVGFTTAGVVGLSLSLIFHIARLLKTTIINAFVNIRNKFQSGTPPH